MVAGVWTGATCPSLQQTRSITACCDISEGVGCARDSSKALIVCVYVCASCVSIFLIWLPSSKIVEGGACMDAAALSAHDDQYVPAIDGVSGTVWTYTGSN